MRNASVNFARNIAAIFMKDTVEHDFNGHEVNELHGVNGKECYDRAFHLANKFQDFTGMHDLSGNFSCKNFKLMLYCAMYVLVSRQSKCLTCLCE